MKNKKKLFVCLMTVSMLFGCKPHGTTSSEKELANKDVFTELFNALGANFYTMDTYNTIFTSGGKMEIEPLYSEMVVEPKAMYNYGTREGIALSKAGGRTVQGYHFTIDTAAQEGEDPFIPSYVASNYYYQGYFVEQGVYELNDSTLPGLFGFYTVEDMMSIAKATTKNDSLEFSDVFVEGVDANNNVTFTATNPYISLFAIENSAFATMDGSSDNFFYNFDEYTSSNATTAIATTFTVTEIDTMPALNVKVEITNAAEFGGIGGKFTFIDRDIIPVALLDEEQKEYFTLDGIIPEDFYQAGPGEASATTKEKLAEFKAYVDTLIEGNNFTLLHDGLDQNNTTTYTTNVYNDHAYTFGGQGFTYGYYFVDPNEDFSNAETAGIRVYSNNQEGEEEFSLLTLADAKKQFEDSGYTVDEKYVAKNTPNGDIDLAERLWTIHESNFSQSAYLKEGYANFWNALYGGSFENSVFYNEITNTFVITNYYLRTALFAYDTLIGNYNTCLSLDLTLINNNASAQVYIFENYENQIGYYTLGRVHIQDVGTTKLPESFVNYVYNATGADFGYVAPETPVVE